MPRPLGQEDFRQASLDYNLFSIKTEALLSILGSAVQMAAFCYCLYLLWSGKILYGTMTLFLSQGTKLTSARLLYPSPSPRDRTRSRMPSSACKKKLIYTIL